MYMKNNLCKNGLYKGIMTKKKSQPCPVVTWLGFPLLPLPPPLSQLPLELQVQVVKASQQQQPVLPQTLQFPVCASHNIISFIPR